MRAKKGVYRAMWVLAVLVLLVLVAVGGWYATIRSVETPSYAVVREEGPFQLRAYPALVAAEVVRSGTREEAVRRGFGPLAGYIFAKERTGEKIAMTAPVTQTQRPDRPSEWAVRFIMPSKHSLETLPRPAGEDVDLVSIPPRRVAAVRFSGRADDDAFEEHRAALETWMESLGLEAEGPPTLAYYDDPFVPGFLRRNEVLIPVEGTPGGG